jgi:hypothetical protein
MDTNTVITRQNGKIVIEIDENKVLYLSKSGKSNVVGTTHGFVDIPGSPIKISLNAVIPV